MIIRHTITYTIFNILPALASLLVLVILTRLMTPTQFGEYSFTIYIATVLVAIFANFLIISLGRFEPASLSIVDRKILHSTVLTVALLISISLSTLLVCLHLLDLLPSLSINYLQLAVIFQISVFLMLSQKLANANFQPNKYGYSQVIKNYFFLGLSTLCLLAGLESNAVLTCFAISSFLAVFPVIRLWERTSVNFFKFSTFKVLWLYGAPLTILYVFVMIIGLSDRLFIDIMLGGTEVGLYSASYDVVQYSIGTLGMIMHLSLFPIIIKAYESGGAEQARRSLEISAKLLFLIITPVASGFFVAGRDISTVLLGESFQLLASQLIPIFAFSIFASVIKSYYFDYSFQIAKATWMQVVPPLIAAILNCFLNYYFILHFDIIGAAYATLISNVVYLILTIFLSKKVFLLPRFPIVFCSKVLFASLLMALFVCFIPGGLPPVFSLSLKVFSGLIVYLFLVYIFLKNDIFLLFSNAKAFKYSD